MDIKYRQPTGHNCGMYAMANVLNSDEFLNEKYLSNPEKGATIFDLNQILVDLGKDYRVETLYKNIFSSRLPDDVVVFPSEKKQGLPLMLTVAFKEGGINHMIGAMAFNDKTLIVYDSLKKETVETDWNGLRELYPVIFGVYAFCPNWNDNYIIFEYS